MSVLIHFIRKEYLMIQLNYRDARPIYSQIADHLRQQILTGILEEGDRLPSVRDL